MVRMPWNKGLTQYPSKESFFKKIILDSRSGCFLWTGKRDRKGYGRTYYHGEIRAHRIAWILNYGQIPNGLHVLHKCDNPSCVNPKHLYLGTNKDNVWDKVNRGRLVIPDNKGESNGQAILKLSQVMQIKKAPKGIIAKLAKSFGISQSTAYAIRANQRWRWVS